MNCMNLTVIKCQLLVHENFWSLALQAQFHQRTIEVQYPVYLKVELLTLWYFDVCKLATQISGCLCAALGWTQTECHCVLNTRISMHRLPPRTIPTVSVVWGIWRYYLFVLNPANSICRTAVFRKSDLFKSLGSRGQMFLVLLFIYWPKLMTSVLFSVNSSSFRFWGNWNKFCKTVVVVREILPLRTLEYTDVPSWFTYMYFLYIHTYLHLCFIHVGSWRPVSVKFVLTVTHLQK